MTEERKQWICTTVDVDGGARVVGGPTQVVSMGVAAKDKLWPKGTVLKVRFLQGPAALHDRVMKAAQSWLVPGVRLQMEAAKAGEAAHLRINFDTKSGSWSYVGTDCRTTRAPASSGTRPPSTPTSAATRTSGTRPPSTTTCLRGSRRPRW
jgi:serralysin